MKDGKLQRSRRTRRNVCRTFTMGVTPQELEKITRLSKLRGRTRSGAVRAAIDQALYLAEAEEQGREWATVNKEGGDIRVVHFVM